jgi:hypothetical protein
MRAELNAKKKITALERQKALLDTLIVFIKAHPQIASQANLHPLSAGKIGLKCEEYALIVPNWKDGDAVLRLVKPGEDWINTMDADAYYNMERTVAEDVGGISDAELETLLDKVYREANPDA